MSVSTYPAYYHVPRTTVEGSPGLEFYEALARFQAEPPHIALDGVNPHYGAPYATLAGILEAIRPKLNQCGLLLTQLPTIADSQPALATRLTHVETGGYLQSTMPLLNEKTTPQGQGSALTYARRYAILALLGLVGDEDDDGNAAEPKPKRNEAPATPQGWNAITANVRSLSDDPDRAAELFSLCVKAASYVKFGETDSTKLSTEQKAELMGTASQAAGQLRDSVVPEEGYDGPERPAFISKEQMVNAWAFVLNVAPEQLDVPWTDA